jgi:hypothetical protein
MLTAFAVAVGLTVGTSRAADAGTAACSYGAIPKANNELWTRDRTAQGTNCKWDHQAGTYITKAYAQERVNGTVWGASPEICRGNATWYNWVGIKTTSSATVYGSGIVDVVNWNTWLRPPTVPNWTTALAACYDDAFERLDGAYTVS